MPQHCVWQDDSSAWSTRETVLTQIWNTIPVCDRQCEDLGTAVRFAAVWSGSQVSGPMKMCRPATSRCSFRHFIPRMPLHFIHVRPTRGLRAVREILYCVQIQATPSHAFMFTCKHERAHTHTHTHVKRLCYLYLNKSSSWYSTGTRPLAVQAAATHLEVNVNIMANKIIPFP